METLASDSEGFVLDQEFLAAWSMSFSDLEFVHGYRHAMRIGITAQLLHFRSHGYFLTSLDDVPSDALEYVADQIGESIVSTPTYDNSSDTARRHRLAILGVCSGWGQNDTIRPDVSDFSICIRP